MAEQGSLSEFLYQRHVEVGDKVNLNFGINEDEDLNEHEVRKLVYLMKASKILTKVVEKKCMSVLMTTILWTSKMNQQHRQIFFWV